MLEEAPGEVPEEAPEGKGRTVWEDLPPAVRQEIESVTGVPVAAGQTLGGGSSPGVRSLLRLTDGETVFVKAVSYAWPEEAALHRSESRVAAALPGTVPTPRFRGSFDDGEWVGMVFDAVAGHEPAQPWSEPELVRVLATLTELAEALTPARSLLALAVEQGRPRLGGWRRIAADADQFLQLSVVSPWAAEHLGRLCDLEDLGVHAAEGESLVHFDLHLRNILLNDDHLYVVDWAFARLGNPLVDLVTLLSSVAADGVDPDRYAVSHPLAVDVEPVVLDGLIAAHAGFCVMASLRSTSVRRRSILDFKRSLGLGAVAWLEGRLDRRG